MNSAKMMDIAEFQRLGFLQEANRLFFHPLGLALATNRQDDGTVTLHCVYDYRDDPEGIIFGEFEPSDIRRADNIETLRQSKLDARAALGCVNGIEPVVRGVLYPVTTQVLVDAPQVRPRGPETVCIGASNDS